MGGGPHTSEFVKRCLTRYGLPGAFQSYVRINERRANRQRELLESNFIGGKEQSELAKSVENKLLSLLFEFVVTPVETAATMVGQGKKVQKLNQSLGAADWGDDHPDSGGYKYSKEAGKYEWKGNTGYQGGHGTPGNPSGYYLINNGAEMLSSSIR